MSSFLLATVGVLLNGAGLCFFGQAVVRYALQGPSAVNAWFWEGTLALILINAGICLVVEAGKRRRQD